MSFRANINLENAGIGPVPPDKKLLSKWLEDLRYLGNSKGSHTPTQPRCMPFPLESKRHFRLQKTVDKGLKPLNRLIFSPAPAGIQTAFLSCKEHPDPLQAATVPRKDLRLKLSATRLLFLAYSPSFFFTPFSSFDFNQLT